MVPLMEKTMAPWSARKSVKMLGSRWVTKLGSSLMARTMASKRAKATGQA